MSVPRTIRLAVEIQAEVSELLAREVHDPGIGFITLTRVQVSADLQVARVYYTTLGETAARKRRPRRWSAPRRFLRRQIGARLRLRRVPELAFVFDESIAHQDRIEQILQRDPPSRSGIRDAERRTSGLRSRSPDAADAARSN